MLMIMPSGSYYCLQSICGTFFWGPHSHDSIWHLALSVAAFTSYPFQAPHVAGVALGGYNILMDIVMYLLSKISIPPLITFFKIFPLVWFLLFTTLGVTVARKINSSPLFVGLFMFFLYFGGSFGYFFTLYHGHTVTGSEGLLAMQSRHILLNVQFGFSLVVVLAIIHIFQLGQLTTKRLIALSLLLITAIGLKFYAGVVCSVLVALYICLAFLKDKNLLRFLKHTGFLFVCAALAVVFFYNPAQALKSGSTFIFSPFAVVHNIIEEPALFYLPALANARYILAASGFGPRLLAIELFSALIYIVFNLGTRVIGLTYLGVKIVKKKSSIIDLILVTTILFSTSLSLLLIQRGVWWNSIQFFYYAIFLSNFFAAQAVYELLKRRKFVPLTIGILILILTVPINFDRIRETFDLKTAVYISQYEIDALEYLKKQPPSIVLTAPYKKTINLPQPAPLYAAVDSAYVVAYSGKKTYISDALQLELLSIDQTKRSQEAELWNCDLMKKVDYIYDLKAIEVKKDLNGCKGEIKKIFENKEVRLFKIMPQRDF